MKYKAVSGVRGVLCCAHRDKDSGKVHGHTYEVTAWFSAGGDIRKRSLRLQDVLRPIDHSTLPDELAWAEDLAKHILKTIGVPCIRVDVSRPAEGFYAYCEVETTKVRWSVEETIRACVMRAEGMSHRKIAERLGRTKNAVKKYLQKMDGGE